MAAADRVRLQECVLNLVRNALVHGGEVGLGGGHLVGTATPWR